MNTQAQNNIQSRFQLIHADYGLVETYSTMFEVRCDIERIFKRALKMGDDISEYSIFDSMAKSGNTHVWQVLTDQELKPIQIKI